MEIWRVNVRSQTLVREPDPPAYVQLGGRGLLARVMRDEVNPTCEPLGAGNKLIFAPGLLVGHMLSSCDRISVGGKSPLTGGIKESNAGGRTGLHLTHLGIKALIIEDKPDDSGHWIIRLTTEGASFERDDTLVGRGVYETAEILIERYGKNVAMALIGPGGEFELSSAGIQNIDKDRVPSRINARGGLGAVMGSKGIKAIVIDKSGGGKPEIADPVSFKIAQNTYNQALMAHPQTTLYNDYGTAAMTMMCNGYGALPTRNFSVGEFEGAELISGEYMRDVLLNRQGDSRPSHACMAGCTIRCSNVFAGEDGSRIVSPLEYETIGLMGSNLGIDSLDTIAKMNWIVNDIGLDSIEVGAALGVAAEAGVWEFGDGERALELLEEIRQRTPLGRVLGHGASVTGRVLGVERVPVVKGQAMSAYEPRAIKGTGVTYATSPQGADHTAGLTIRAKIDHLDPKGQVELSRSAQINVAGYDALGVCSFGTFGFAAAPGVIQDLLLARYGWEAGDDVLQTLGRETLSLEREFNRMAGFTRADDRLPEWMTREEVAPHNTVFDVPDEELDSLFDGI
jgi:aldehyde:ferredoxin oxidoreductase